MMPSNLTAMGYDAQRKSLRGIELIDIDLYLTGRVISFDLHRVRWRLLTAVFRKPFVDWAKEYPRAALERPGRIL